MGETFAYVALLGALLIVAEMVDDYRKGKGS